MSCHHDTNTTNKAVGNPLSAKSHILDNGAAATQDFGPVNNICAHLNAFHCYADERDRYVEATHFCAHLNEDVRQCLIYDSPEPNARLIGVEYMITPALFETLDTEERKLWHTHVFEVKSGQLIMPKPALIPTSAWEIAENKEMEEVITLYGKTFHFWQVDRGDKLPLGMPKLMGSYTEKESFPEFDKVMKDRDSRYGVDHKEKAKVREYIKVPDLHPGEYLPMLLGRGEVC
ncbi:DUF1264-domain-containing protein [Ascobolus immersus RN42]|uniref:DUF1264-domain-containing protein n=1 Tax=Ascobolus immersus RN42 TaxID=1160509 RepID=A0A3N4I0U4_ASCIM|nr:DUF1264-domain-containing protein [Ascobolus immersus RN42]